MILGTAAYMSPEQARGKPVDKRADVWSFGVLLWEMLTGRSLFAGDTVTDVIAAVVTREPDLDALPTATPRAVRRLLGRCLRKDPRTRLPDIGAARLELQDVLAGTPSEPGGAAAGADARPRPSAGAARASAGPGPPSSLARRRSPATSAAGRLTRRPEIRGRRRTSCSTRPRRLAFADWGAPAVSPDGRHVAFAAARRGRERPGRSGSAPSTPRAPSRSPGPRGPARPFWSPDSASLAFFAGGELRKISLASGAVQRICALPPGRASPRAATGAADGTILFSAGGDNARLYTVSASGGEAKPLTTLDESRGETGHWWPQFLPDGATSSSRCRRKEPERRGLHVASLDEPHARRRLLPTLTRAEFQAGHLLFVRDATLFAQPFDVTRGSPTGEPSAVASSVAAWQEVPDWGWFSAQGGGLVAYRGGREPGLRAGVVRSQGVEARGRWNPGEPCPARPVAGREAGRGAGDRPRSRARGPLDDRPRARCRHAPDVGRREREQPHLVGRTDARSSSRRTANRRSESTERPSRATSPRRRSGRPRKTRIAGERGSGRQRAALHARSKGGYAIGALSLTGDKDPEPISSGPTALDEPQLSPDGRWLASAPRRAGVAGRSTSSPTGAPASGCASPPDGGGQPKWRGDGKELFYVTRGGLLMAVEVRASSDRLDVGLPVRLFGGVQGTGRSTRTP